MAKIVFTKHHSPTSLNASMILSELRGINLSNDGINGMPTLTGIANECEFIIKQHWNKLANQILVIRRDESVTVVIVRMTDRIQKAICSFSYEKN